MDVKSTVIKGPGGIRNHFEPPGKVGINNPNP